MLVPALTTPVLDFACQSNRIYVVMLNGSAWVWENATRTQLFADQDERNKAMGMVAVNCSAGAAFFCDWNGQLWQTGNVYRYNEAAETWEQQLIEGYVEKIAMNADRTQILGPHGIGPSALNTTTLWVNTLTALYGKDGPHQHGELMNGLLPSSPNPIKEPMRGATSWRDSPELSPPAIRVGRVFSYMNNIWQALAMSNMAAYCAFKQPERRVGGGGRNSGRMVG